MGYSPRRLEEVERELLWWGWARAGAAAARRPLLQGWGLAWGPSGYAELVPMEVSRAGRCQVTVRVDVSAVSPGTERAQFLRLPNTTVGPLGRPGYSGAGTVIEAGPGTSSLRPGDPVAVTGAPHASVATVGAASAYRVPEGVAPEAAALVQLGIVASVGVEAAKLEHGQPFCVVGAGLVGALALRIAVARGAEARAVVAASRAKEPWARVGGARSFLVVGEDDAAVGDLSAPVVIDATGSPTGFAVALEVAGPRGRVVLLGSPRGVTPDLGLGRIQGLRLEVVGAHVDTVDLLDTASGVAAGSGRRRAGEAFLEALAAGLTVSDLCGEELDPREAGLFYRRLAHDRELISAHFSWSRLPSDWGVRGGHLMRLPDLAARGVEPERRPLVPRPRTNGPLRWVDPLAGATGMLRVGMVGCGDIAGRNAAAIAAAPNVRLVATYDPQGGLAEEVARRYGADAMLTGEALVTRSDVDAVLLCVPHHLHRPLCLEALRAGRHVIVEKPMAESLAAAKEMAAEASRSGRALSVCFPQRYDPVVLVGRRLIKAGAIGPPAGGLAKLYLDKSPAYWLGGFSSRTTSTWRSSRAQAGGGVLIMNLSHYLDLLHHLMGLAVDKVTATAEATARDGGDIEDTVSVGLTFTGGSIASVVGGSAMSGSDASELRVWGQDGQLVVEPAARIFTLRAIEGLRPGRWYTLGRRQSLSARTVYFSRLGSAIHEGRQPEVGPSDGLAVQAVIEAAYRSALEGRSERPAALLEELES